MNKPSRHHWYLLSFLEVWRHRLFCPLPQKVCFRQTLQKKQNNMYSFTHEYITKGIPNWETLNIIGIFVISKISPYMYLGVHYKPCIIRPCPLKNAGVVCDKSHAWMVLGEWFHKQKIFLYFWGESFRFFVYLGRLGEQNQHASKTF
jgi:hypothetical protein